ncbi:MAG: hypothetical protein ABI606_13355 [Rhodoferax sp.]
MLPLLWLLVVKKKKLLSLCLHLLLRLRLKLLHPHPLLPKPLCLLRLTLLPMLPRRPLMLLLPHQRSKLLLSQLS